MTDGTAECASEGCTTPRATRNSRCWGCINRARKPKTETRTCTVVFSDGTPCSGLWKYKSGLCAACYNWTRNNGGSSPHGRARHVTAERGERCPVKFSNGTACRRQATAPTGFCEKCARWSRANGTSPLGRNYVRGNGDVLREIEAAAHADTDDCVILTLNSGSRPVVKLNGVNMNASRAVWIVANGDPGELHVLHSCSWGSGAAGCVNIRHLYLGNHGQNMIDMRRAGRAGMLGAKGAAHPATRLTWLQVSEIRRDHRKGSRFPDPHSSRALAQKYNVSTVYVWQLVNEKRRA